MTTKYNISEVSNLTGIPKDLLRMWERRYGYPCPQRDENGDRRYSQSEVEKLRLIRQLIDQGKRPGKLVKLEPHALTALLSQPKAPLDITSFIRLLAESDDTAIRDWLHQQLQHHGLREFIQHTLAPLTQAVGEAWANGEIAIHHEHLYTEVVKLILRKALVDLPQTPDRPRIMLTTVPGEQHSLGLLMVEVLIRLSGAKPISFGTEMPFQEIKAAADYHQVDVIALSFSKSFKGEDAIVMLSGLRQLIDPSIQLWAGGGALKDQQYIPEGVEKLGDLSAIEKQLQQWDDN